LLSLEEEGPVERDVSVSKLVLWYLRWEHDHWCPSVHHLSFQQQEK